MHIRDADLGQAVPIPATYSGTSWGATTYTVCRAPDRVAFWYYAGARSNDYERGKTCDPLSQEFAWITIWLAIPKLERPPCSCNRLQNLFEYLRVDMAENVPNGSSFFMNDAVMANPFGTHRGEIMAWNRLRGWVQKKPHVAMI